MVVDQQRRALAVSQDLEPAGYGNKCTRTYSLFSLVFNFICVHARAMGGPTLGPRHPNCVKVTRCPGEDSQAQGTIMGALPLYRTRA